MHKRLQFTLISGLASLTLVGCAGVPVQITTPAPAKAAEAPKPEAAEADKLRPSSSGLVQSMIERRQSMTATGYAVISVQNHRLPAQQRLLAIRASKLDAYRALTEQVYGQYLDATTTVADMVVQSDSFRARVEGVIYGATLVSITPVGDDTYETTLSLESSVVDDIRSLYLKQLASARTR